MPWRIIITIEAVFLIAILITGVVAATTAVDEPFVVMVAVSGGYLMVIGCLWRLVGNNRPNQPAKSTHRPKKS